MKVPAPHLVATLITVLAVVQHVSAAEYFPELDDPKYGMEWKSIEYRRATISQELAKEAKKLFESGEYSKALGVIERADRIGPDRDYRLQIQKSKIFDKLGRKEEALKIATALFDQHYLDEDICELYVNLLIEANQGPDAVKACNKIAGQSYGWYEWPSVLLARAQWAAGRHTEAIETAKLAYFHFAHTGEPCEKLKSFLDEQHAEIPDINNMRNRSQNDDFLRCVKEIASIKKSIDKETYQRLFPQSVDMRGTIMAYGDNRKGNGVKLVTTGGVLTYDDRDGAYFIVLNVDTDKVSLLQKDIEESLGKGKDGFHSRHPHEYRKFPMIAYADGEPHMIFVFSHGGIHPLIEVRVSWLNEQAKPKVTPSTYVTKTLDEEDKILNNADSLLKKNHFRKVAQMLVNCWEDAYGDRDKQRLYRQMQRKREMLAVALDGLRREDIARFIRVAPLEYIRAELTWAEYDPKKLISINEYQARRWKVEREDINNSYVIKYHRYNPPVSIDKDNTKFSEFCKYFGDMKTATKEIPPMPAELIDRRFLEID